MPRGSMLKYFQDRGGSGSQHGGQLIWPGTADGYPVRSEGLAAPDLRQSEYDNIPLRMDFHSAEFRLWVAAERDEYNTVMDRIVNGWYMQHKRFDDRVPEGRLVYLEWVQIYGEQITGKSPGAPPSGHAFTIERNQPAPPAPVQRPRIDDDRLGWPDKDWQPWPAGGPDNPQEGAA